MKIIVVAPLGTYNKEASATLNPIEDCGRISVVADSALLTHGKPMFAPSWGGECKGQWCVAARISRLGKTIPLRFAWERYCDGLSLAVKFEAVLPVGSCDVMTNFDGAVCCGEFMERPADDTTPLPMEMQVGSSTTAAELRNYAEIVGEAIHTASMFMSVRQGDILLAPIPGCPPFAAVRDTHVAGTMEGRKTIEFNIK